MPKKTEAEIKIEQRMESLSENPKELTEVFNKVKKADTITEALLREFLQHVKKTTDPDSIALICSVKHTACLREAGVAKNIADLGGPITKGGNPNFKKNRSTNDRGY